MRRIIGHYETRPGLRLEDPPVEVPVAKDLETVPGIPSRPEEIAFYSREEPLESVAVEESASAEWASGVRQQSVELRPQRDSLQRIQCLSRRIGSARRTGDVGLA